MKRMFNLHLFFIAILLFKLFPTFAANNPEIKLTNELIITEDTIYDPDILNINSIVEFEKRFDFKWDDYQTISRNKDKAQEVEQFIASRPNLSELNTSEKQAYANLLYKAGTYYSHVLHQPTPAIQFLQTAYNFIDNKLTKVWIMNQLAYAYQMQYAKSQNATDRDLALLYIKPALLEGTKNKNALNAFAYTIAGMVEAQSLNLDHAEKCLRSALNFYNQAHMVRRDPYIRTENRLAQVLISENKNQEAKNLLQTIKKQWLTKGHIEENPYAAATLFTLGELYLNENDWQSAQLEYIRGANILENIYGQEDPTLIKPYQELNTIYKMMGNLSIAAVYENKLNVILNKQNNLKKYCTVDKITA